MQGSGSKIKLAQVLTICLVACGCTKTVSDSSRTAAAATAAGQFDLGHGLTEYDYIVPEVLYAVASGGAAPGPCVAADTDSIDFGGQRSASINEQIQEQASYSWLSAALNASLSVRARMFGVTVASASVDTKFRADNINTKVSFTSISAFDTTVKTAFLKNYLWTTDAAALAKQVNTAYGAIRSATNAQERAIATARLNAAMIPFYLRCGDRFVNQSALGASFRSSMRVAFQDNRSLLDFMVTATAKILRTKKTFNHDDSYDVHIGGSAVQVDLSQQGGNQAHFQAFKASLPGDQACFPDKSINFTNSQDFQDAVHNELEPCLQRWDATNKYLRSDFYQQLQSGPVTDLIPVGNQWVTYYEAGLLKTPLVLPDATKKQLSHLNKLFKALAKLNMIAENSQNAAAVSQDAANKIAGSWAALNQNFAGANAQTSLLIGQVSGAITQCLGAIKNASNSGCDVALPDFFGTYNTLYFDVENMK